MDYNSIKEAIISFPDEVIPLDNIILNRNIYGNYYINLYKKGICVENKDEIFYSYRNISRIYCLTTNGIKSLCIDYLNKKIELTSCFYSGNGTEEENDKNRILDGLEILLKRYWKNRFN